MSSEVNGREVLERLAEIYPQLYIKPSGNGTEQYRQVAGRGILPEVRSLDHFITDERDTLVTEHTPAGDINVVTFVRREDFETFYRIMGCRCTLKELPRSMGAAIIDGIPNWTKIRGHLEEYAAGELAAGREPDRTEEFRRFTSVKENYLDALIVLSIGEYSNIPAERFGFDRAEWIRLSHEIRRAHECTHFICRRKFPELKNAVPDEIIADAAGIYAAFGRYDRDMEAVFLGVSAEGYTGGRLENYAADGDIELLAARVYSALMRIGAICAAESFGGAYDLAVRLEQRLPEWWG